MKTNNILSNFILGVLAVAASIFIFFIGKDFGYFLAGLKPTTDIGDIGYNVGYSLGYLLLPIITLLLLYMAYKFLHKKKHA